MLKIAICTLSAENERLETYKYSGVQYSGYIHTTNLCVYSTYVTRVLIIKMKTGLP